MIPEKSDFDTDPYATIPRTPGLPETAVGATPADSSAQDTTFAYSKQKSAASASARPMQIGRYEILGEIARGGMGVVYRAFDPLLDRTVAIKLIKSGELAEGDQIERFQTEAKAAAQLDHPGIVQVFEVGQFGGQHFMAMAYIDGHSLWHEVKESPLAPKRAAKLMHQVAEAIQFAHERGIVHRDLKPQNILLTKDGQPKVTDFGLAKRQEHDGSLTQTGQALGTPSYMPPEQAKGQVKEIGPLADVYSLGATLYCLLTGRPPFQAATQLETMLQVVEQEPAPLRQLNPSVPRDLETICHKCLEKDPKQRYAAAALLVADLDRFERDLPILARPASRWEHLWRWCRRNPGIAGWSSAAAAFLFVAALVSTLAWIRETRLVGEKTELITQKDTLLGEKEGLIGVKEKLIVEKDRLAIKERSEREKAEQRERELRIESARNSFAHGIAEYDAGRPQAANRDLLRALALLPDDHELRPSYLRVAWDRATSAGQVHRILGEHSSFAGGILRFSPDSTRLLTVTRSTLLPSQHSTVSALITSGLLSTKITDFAAMAQLWDVGTGLPIGLPMQHAGPISSAEFSPDGTVVMTAVETSRAIQLWDAWTGKPIGKPMQHEDNLRFATFSPDGSRILTLTGQFQKSKGTALIWNTQSGELVGQPMRHDGEILHAAFSPNGLLIATGSRRYVEQRGSLVPLGGVVEIWDGISGAAIGEPLLHGEAVQYVAFNAAGTRLVSQAANGYHWLWDVPAGMKQVAQIYASGAFALPSFNPAGTQLITASGNDALVWDAQTGARIVNQMPHLDLVFFVGYTPDGRRILTNCRNGSLQLWDARSQRRLGPPIRQDSWTMAAALSPDGTRVATVTGNSRLAIWDITHEALSSSQPTRLSSASLVRAALNPDGTRLVAVHMSNEAILCDTETFALIGEPLRHERLVNWASFSPNGDCIVTASDDHTVRMWDAHSGKPLGEPFRHDAFVRFAAIHPKGTSMVTITSQKLAFLWDLQKSADGQKPETIASEAVRAGFSPEGSQILFSRTLGLQLWDERTRTNRDVLTASTIPFKYAQLSPDGRRLLAHLSDNSARMFDATSGAPLTEAMRYERALQEVGFSADGRRVVTSSGDMQWTGTARLWDPDTGAAMGLPLTHEWSVTSSLLSPDGKGLITASADGLRTWDVEEIVPPLESGLETLQTLTALEVNHQGAVSDVWDVTREQSWREFLARREPWWLRREELAAGHRIEFHRRTAQLAEADSDWFAAAHHLRQLIRLSPNDESLRRRSEIAARNSRYDQPAAAPPAHDSLIDSGELLRSRDYTLVSAGLPAVRHGGRPFLKDGCFTIEDQQAVWAWNIGHVLRVGERIHLRLQIEGTPEAMVGVSLQDDGKKPSRTSGTVVYLKAGGEFGVDPESFFVAPAEGAPVRAVSTVPNPAVHKAGSWNELEVTNLGDEISIAVNGTHLRTIDRRGDRLEHPILALVLNAGPQVARARLAEYSVFAASPIIAADSADAARPENVEQPR